MASNIPYLDIQNLSKSFDTQTLFHNISFSISEGQRVGLIAKNGTGKSTLLSILTGKESQDEGNIIFKRDLTMGFLEQSPHFNPDDTVLEACFNHNGNEEKILKAKQILTQLKITDLAQPIKELSGGQQKRVALANVLITNPDLLILDEPTSSLNDEDSKMLLDMLIRFKKEKGITSIIITHKLQEVAYVADEITVIRDGMTIETIDNSNHAINEERIIKGMVGRELEDRYPKRDHIISDEIMFEAKDWTVYHPIYTEKCVVDNISFHVKKGEVVGFSGLQGAGRTELAKSLFGKSYGSRISGKEFIANKEVFLNSARDAIVNGLAYVTEDRKTDGLILSESIAKNTTLARMEKIADKKGIVDISKENNVAKEYVKAMKTKTPSIHQKVGNLSGGNQQKVLLAKWMFAGPEVLFLDEPTRGIDVGAKYEIYSIINDMVKEGKSVVMISSDLTELLGMCDRIYVMNAGKITGEFSAEEATQEKIMSTILKSDCAVVK